MSQPFKSGAEPADASRGQRASRPFGATAEQLVADLQEGRDPDPGALTDTTRDLRAYVGRVFPDLDAEEIVQSTVVRLLDRRDRLAETQIDNAWAYLITAARNAALDALRARRRERALQIETARKELVAEEDAVAGLLDRAATHEMVLAAMSAGVQAGDAVTIPIITVWLDLADKLARAPSTREVAAQAGVSHTTVATALRRFKALIAEVS